VGGQHGNGVEIMRNNKQSQSNVSEIKWKAIKYIRLSNTDDDKRGGESDSVVSQRRIIDDFLLRHPDIEVVAEKVDDGFSGILFDRPAFKEMMDEIEQGNVNCVICKDLSRLGREYIETGRYLRRIFPAYGVRFLAINDNIDTLNDNGDDLSISIRSIVNDAYCRDISIKTRSALASKRKNGNFVGAMPIYGYAKARENRNHLVVDDCPASIVRDIFRLRMDGNSAARIAQMLNERGILSPIEYKKSNGLPHAKGGFTCTGRGVAKWSATTIIRILNDETYTGTLVQGKQSTPNYKLREMQAKPKSEWHRIENTHEAIIPQHSFDLVQKIMKLDTRTSPNQDRVYTFSGILICGSCGNSMVRKSVPNRDKSVFYTYYRCTTGKKNGCSLGASIKENDLNYCVFHGIRGHISNIAQMDKLLKEPNSDRAANELARNLTARLRENEERLDKLRKFKAGLHESLVNDVLSKGEHKALKAKYDEDIKALVTANALLEGEIDDTLSLQHESTAWMEYFKGFENIDTAHAIDRKTVICLIHSIHIHSKREIEITYAHQADFESIMALLEMEVV